MSKYILQKSSDTPYWWVLTDTEAQIVIRFKEGDFNGTAKFTPLQEATNYDISSLPGIVSAMGDWLRENHYEIIFSSPQKSAHDARESIGRQLRQARETKGLSLRQLSKLTGIAYNHIARIEGGKYNVTLDTIAIIADVLEVRLSLF